MLCFEVIHKVIDKAYTLGYKIYSYGTSQHLEFFPDTQRRHDYINAYIPHASVVYISKENHQQLCIKENSDGSIDIAFGISPLCNEKFCHSVSAKDAGIENDLKTLKETLKNELEAKAVQNQLNVLLLQIDKQIQTLERSWANIFMSSASQKIEALKLLKTALKTEVEYQAENTSFHAVINNWKNTEMLDDVEEPGKKTTAGELITQHRNVFFNDKRSIKTSTEIAIDALETDTVTLGSYL